jgi:hypothetical protein
MEQFSSETAFFTTTPQIFTCQICGEIFPSHMTFLNHIVSKPAYSQAYAQ